MTVGLRADRPVYIENALENPAVTALTFHDKDGNLVIGWQQESVTTDITMIRE